jgi:hypothetical protein
MERPLTVASSKTGSASCEYTRHTTLGYSLTPLEAVWVRKKVMERRNAQAGRGGTGKKIEGIFMRDVTLAKVPGREEEEMRGN